MTSREMPTMSFGDAMSVGKTFWFWLAFLACLAAIGGAGMGIAQNRRS
jgi:hypothetical protein